MSLKALLFNRWCHWGGWANPEGFKEWYEEYYVDGKWFFAKYLLLSRDYLKWIHVV